MYTRNYFESGDVTVPRGYDGVALCEEASVPPADCRCADDCRAEDEKGGFLRGLFESLHISLPSLEKIGFEEILIVAIAAFLFFSADGDRECALILLALLLIN